MAGTIDAVVLLPAMLIVCGIGSRCGATALHLAVIVAAGVVGYRTYFHARYGQTIGKLVVGVRITRHDGATIGPAQAWNRTVAELLLLMATSSVAKLVVGALLLALHDIRSVPLLRAAVTSELAGIGLTLFLWNIAGLVFMMANSRRRALQDLLAGTMAVSDQVQRRRSREEVELGKLIRVNDAPKPGEVAEFQGIWSSANPSRETA
jgi:uncharacterized RDD family membrane protein YckC